MAAKRRGVGRGVTACFSAGAALLDRRWSHCDAGAPRPTKAKTETTGQHAGHRVELVGNCGGTTGSAWRDSLSCGNQKSGVRPPLPDIGSDEACPVGASVLGGEHNGQDPHGQARVAGIFAAVGERRIVVVDLPENRLAGVRERSEIVLLVRIIVGSERVEQFDLFANRRLISKRQGADARRLNQPAGSRLEMRPFVTASDQALGKKDRCAIAGRISGVLHA